MSGIWEMRKRIQIVLRIMIVFLVFISCIPSSQPPKMIRGELDLQDWILKEKGVLSLKGEWEFYWNEFLFPEDFTKKDSKLENKTYLIAPSIWNGKKVQGVELPGYGFGTYRLKIQLNSEEEKNLSLYTLEQAHSYRIFINGELRGEKGKVAKSQDSFKPDYHTEIYDFVAKDEFVEIIFHVSNFSHRVGGLRNEIEIGTSRKLHSYTSLNLLLEAFLYGGFFIISIYHLAIFYYRRSNSAPFYFAILSSFIMIFSAIVGDRFLYKIFPALWSWETNYKLEFSFVTLIVWSITLFLDNLFSDKNKFYIFYSKFIKIYSILFLLFVLAFPARIFTEFYIILILLMALSIIGIIITIIFAVKRKKEGAYEFLFGFSILILCTVHDISVAYSLFDGPLLIKFGLTGMILSQAILLAKIFTGDFKRAENLTFSLQEINSAYSKFVPTEFLNLLGKKSILDIKLGTHSQKRMSILFVDIRSFTSISESMSPQENFEFLNSYLKRITPIINQNNGFIDKFIGDGIMALFPGKVDDAVRSAIEIHTIILEYNSHRKNSGYEPISVGVGIHTGNLILGTIGHKDRMEGTVISDAVNLASRVEGLTKHYKAKILLSEDSFKELENSNQYKFRILDTVRVKGKKKSISIIEILDGYEEDILKLFLDTKESFDQAIQFYKQKSFKDCVPLFEKVYKINQNDFASKLYLERAKYNQEFGLPPDWEGIEEIESK